MAILLPTEATISVESCPSKLIAELDYRRAVAEFDHLWETQTNHDMHHRMIELLEQIEAYECMSRLKSQ